MPRLPNMTNRDEVPAALVDAFDRVASLRNGAVSGPYGVLLHSPALAEAAAALGQYVRWNSALTPAQRETAVIVVARHMDAKVMWSAHARLAREAGVRDAVVDVVGHRGDPAALEADEAAIVRYVRELYEDNRVSPATFEALRALVGDQGIVDVTGLTGYYTFVGSVLNAFEIDPAPGAEPLPD